MQSAAVKGILLWAVQATITLELKLSLPTTISGSPKSLGVVDNTLKKSEEAETQLFLPQSIAIKCSVSIQPRNMLQYTWKKLADCCSKIMQSAAVKGILLWAVQATITLELNITTMLLTD
jgi:hypothetical protein